MLTSLFNHYATYHKLCHKSGLPCHLEPVYIGLLGIYCLFSKIRSGLSQQIFRLCAVFCLFKKLRSGILQSITNFRSLVTVFSVYQYQFFRLYSIGFTTNLILQYRESFILYIQSHVQSDYSLTLPSTTLRALAMPADDASKVSAG